MKLPKAKRQGEVVERLEKEVRTAMRKLERGSIAGLQGLWDKTKEDIKAGLIVEYKRAVPTGRWNVNNAKSSGAIFRMEHSIMKHMDGFKALAKSYINSEIRKHFEHEYYTSAYILDQVTPPSCRVKLNPTMKESAMKEATISAGPMAAVKWYQRFDGWANAYESGLRQNIMLNAINSGLADDVAAEVDATRAGTPAITFWDAMGRLFLTELLNAQAMAREQMVGLNDNMVADEIWQTREDEKVCEICGPLDGLTREEAEAVDPEADMPMHPNCRCFWRVMPKDWIELSKSDPVLAHALDVAEAVPDGMYIRDNQGNIKAAVVVSFTDWAKDKISVGGH